LVVDAVSGQYKFQPKPKVTSEQVKIEGAQGNSIVKVEPIEESKVLELKKVSNQNVYTQSNKKDPLVDH
jgi:hypothetical protein